MPYTTLIETDTLSGLLRDPEVAVVDCRYDLKARDWGAHEYANQHIPGAVYASLDADLSGVPTGQNGRHPLPISGTLERTFGRLGIANGVQVVAYDQDSGMFASRLWWLLRWMGHDAVAVLNGGFAKWVAEGQPTTSGHEAREPREFSGSPRIQMTADASEVARLAGRRDSALVDARAPERFRGDIEPLDRVPGHIPGAVNRFFKDNLDERGEFRAAASLREQLDRTIGGVAPERVVCYCGSGVTACHNLLAMELAGLPGARLYPGSWSEWSSDPSRPVERSSREKDDTAAQ